MQGRSIRSFALDYYRKQGAEIRPLEASGAYEIVPPDGAAIRVTFDADAEEIPLTSTSPQWRAILEDLTSELAVSYRYLVTGPIANPAAALTPLVHKGWEVKSARFVKAEQQQAVGVTHRVTFDSPALNVRKETLHHHVWNLADDERLLALEAALYQLPCLLLRPETQPNESHVERLVDRSVTLVDVAVDQAGAEIEFELGELLSEAEKRTNQYFEQQMNNVLQREVALTEKLDATIRRLTEAKTPEQVARYRQDGETLASQLEALKARREQDLAAVEAACQAKLVEEREKHELTATTDLVALCHATYDVLTYQARLADPDGREIDWPVRFWPVLRQIELPACPYCFSAMSDPVILPDGDYACAGCVTHCSGCNTRHAKGRMQASTCGTCRTAVCNTCMSRCIHCDVAACSTHEQGCGTCEAPVCTGCAKVCAACETQLCQGHAHRNAVDGKFYCADHRALMPTEAAPEPEPEPEPESPALEADVASILVALEPEAEFEVEADLELLAAEAPVLEIAVPQERPERMVWARTEVCHACHGDFEVQEMVDCSTCGVPVCLHCAEGEHGPCPACDALEPVEAKDPRLAYVFAQFPKLATGRRWQVAEFGPYVVTMWSRLGWWGMVVYHVGTGEPVTLTDFACGPLETTRTRLKVWLGGRK